MKNRFLSAPRKTMKPTPLSPTSGSPVGILTGHHPKSKFLAGKSRSLGLTAAALPVICALSFAGETSAAIVLFADNFNRGNSTDLNASTAGKSGTLGTLNWNERVIGGDMEILSNQMNFNSGSDTALTNVPYVNHNFTGLTQITVEFDFISASASGGIRYLGFSIGNAKATLDALTASGPFGDIGIYFDRATSLTPFTSGVVIREAGNADTYITRTLAANDTLSATFTFADMNIGTAINYEVFHEGISIHTGSHAWSATDQNYIGFSNTHRQTAGDNNIIDNFSVSTIPEPSTALLGGIGLLALLRRRRN